MKASVGDRIRVAATCPGDPARDGEVLEVSGPGGTPPYLVLWADGGRSLFFPGPAARLRYAAEEALAAAGRAH